jgi:putative ABC transport system substrate-binding protein
MCLEYASDLDDADDGSERWVLEMKRREFLALFTSAACGLPCGTRAQPTPKMYRVGLIRRGAYESEPDSPAVKAMLEGLRDLGYVEGQNLKFLRRSAEGGGPERAGEIGAQLIRDGIDLIVVASTSDAKEMKRVTSTVPIVMASSVDPVAAGVVESLARPGANVTGLAIQATPEVDAKRLQLLKEVVPSATRVAFLGLASDWGTTNAESVNLAAQKLGIKLVYVEHSPTDFSAAFAMIARDPLDAILVAANSASFANRRIIIGFTEAHKIATMYPWQGFVTDGGLMSYGANITDQFRRAARYVDKIFKGANPGELPVELADRYALLINLKTAKAIGLEIPAPVLSQAVEVIE